MCGVSESSQLNTGTMVDLTYTHAHEILQHYNMTLKKS